jgi:hypothetical protein
MILIDLSNNRVRFFGIVVHNAGENVTGWLNGRHSVSRWVNIWYKLR